MVKKENYNEFKVGDMIRITKAQDCVGFILELSDTWTPSQKHHAKVFWIAGDYAETSSAPTWMPVNLLECISKNKN